MGNLFNEFLYRPLFNALIFLYQNFSFQDLGIAIILLTIFIRLILFPLFYKSSKDQAIIQRLAPKIKEIQNNHKHDREKQARAMLDLYREHKVSPFSGFFLLLLQLPVLIALYQVFLGGFSVDGLKILYSFVPKPASLNHFFLGLIDLSRRNLVIIFLAALTQYYQGKLSLPRSAGDSKSGTPTENMAKQMVYLGPILTVFFLYFLNLPSAIALYWLTTSVFSVIQQMIINRSVSDYFGSEKPRSEKTHEGA